MGLWADVSSRKLWPTAHDISLGILLASYWWLLRDNIVLHFAASVAALSLLLDPPVAVRPAKMLCQNFRYSLGGDNQSYLDGCY